MKNKTKAIRLHVSDLLIRLAFWVRPHHDPEWTWNVMRDMSMFGNSFTVVDPRKIFLKPKLKSVK